MKIFSLEFEKRDLMMISFGGIGFFCCLKRNCFQKFLEFSERKIGRKLETFFIIFFELKKLELNSLF
ncbi:hypothetical protein BSK20_02875 [SR1 bacterium human oral taxon HOT-345]|nr:hypothetical protein BSK20_02875 [SR1 bacterium human oral taxon HOT-345]